MYDFSGRKIEVQKRIEKGTISVSNLSKVYILLSFKKKLPLLNF